ncbi:type II secretion system protein [Parelusimicrobium proximum]|uniref:type II secretion system protein n=1 Tax=Parelusimicrobium proximum TaxID=3228953 RepID=UPI003D169181
MNKKAFTLLEVLIVVFILSLLALVAVPAYLDSVDEARNNEAKLVLKRLGEAYRTAKTRYPYCNFSNAKITNTLFNVTGTCGLSPYCTSSHTLAVGELKKCDYMGSEDFDKLPYEFYICDTKTGSVNAACKSGDWAVMKGTKNSGSDYGTSYTARYTKYGEIE